MNHVNQNQENFFYMKNHKIQIIDHSTNGTSVNGARLHRDSIEINYTDVSALPEVLMAGLDEGEIHWSHVIGMLKSRGWDDGVGYLVLVEHTSQETREDDVGIGVQQVVTYQPRMTVEEFLSPTTMIGRHDTLFQTSSNGDSHHSRQKTPPGAAVDMQHIIRFNHLTKPPANPKTPKQRAFGGENLRHMSLHPQVPLQKFHLTGYAADPLFVITNQQYFHQSNPREPNLKIVHPNAMSGTIQYQIFINWKVLALSWVIPYAEKISSTGKAGSKKRSELAKPLAETTPR